MLRIVSAAVRGVATRATIPNLTSSIPPAQYSIINSVQRNFGALSSVTKNWSNTETRQQKTLVSHAVTEYILPSTLTPTIVPARSLTKFSLRKGKRKSVKAVLDRFYRLNWGIWIRTKAGRDNNLWKKTAARKRRLRQHVFCNATQSWLLDTMVTKYWRRPRFYVDDPYNPYHQREEFLYTRKKPLP